MPAEFATYQRAFEVSLCLQTIYNEKFHSGKKGASQMLATALHISINENTNAMTTMTTKKATTTTIPITTNTTMTRTTTSRWAPSHRVPDGRAARAERSSAEAAGEGIG